ncbi:Pkinase-domain-containing protein [Neoconidiobolus thromboides FSU 785]|nr:Pkinase-domain-containing protein [Neoconidiobolus thromboides FSU 785]
MSGSNSDSDNSSSPENNSSSKFKTSDSNSSPHITPIEEINEVISQTSQLKYQSQNGLFQLEAEEDEKKKAHEPDSLLQMESSTPPTQIRPDDLDVNIEFKINSENSNNIGYLRGVVGGRMQHYWIEKNKSYWFGRSHKCDYPLAASPNGFLSSKHFMLSSVCQKESDYYPVVITDNSSNGTLINGVNLVKGKPTLIAQASAIDCDEFTQLVFFYLRGDPGKEFMSHNGLLVTSTTLGKGAFARVNFGLDLNKTTQCAVKILTKSRLGWGSNNPKANNITNEIKILKSLVQSNIIKIVDVIDSNRTLCIFLPYVSGGDLHNYIVTQERKKIPEVRAAYIFFQVARALEYLHSRGVAHRDVKPENILLNSTGLFPHVYVTDFGMARVTGNTIMHSMCGTYQYLAPEIIKSNQLIDEDDPIVQVGYDCKVDCWSAGVLLYAMLSGTLPFSQDDDATNHEALFKQIVRGKLNFNHESWDNVSPSARSLVMKLIHVNILSRYDMKQTLSHAFIKKYFNIIAEKYAEIEPGFKGLTHEDLSKKFYPQNYLAFVVKRKANQSQATDSPMKRR